MKPEGLFVEFLVGGHWRNDHEAGLFPDEDAALDYLQTHLKRYEHLIHLRISTKLYKVMADGLYVMSGHRGWQKFEGVQS